MRILNTLAFAGLVAGCATVTKHPERSYIPKPPEVTIWVRHLSHEKPFTYQFDAHEPNAPAVTLQEFEILAPQELKGRTVAIKILAGNESPLQTAEYFHLKVPRYLLNQIEGPRRVGDHYEFDDGWNFAALVVEPVESEKKE